MLNSPSQRGKPTETEFLVSKIKLSFDGVLLRADEPKTFLFAHCCGCDEATVISGTKLANQVLQEVQRDVESWISVGNKRPHLTVVLVGDNPASHIYVRNKIKAAAAVGISSEIIVRPKDISEEELLDLTVQLNKDSRVSGLLVQLPLPGKDRWLLPRISFWGLKGRLVPSEPWKAGISGRV
ncbi:bifunctional methylenetetrahydrofolate dehydrogenase/cyclohydrolase 2, mitochondrial-like [Manacus candei]|uniref:bifunctional methylenetetrahydrofolate dehydrogenase/cyclohydrolase 2, mitochondrial-like n=1 Tax=Manacus candei TaxID=415023 RepID=UPI002227E40B|nr:bifunctional methylenetetrahydrofolate dehydrogenase/cyclohydrolase 2, mitochondrial-like [Manacus candei]